MTVAAEAPGIGTAESVNSRRPSSEGSMVRENTMSFARAICLAAAAVALIDGTARAQEQGKVAKVGEKMSYTFQQPMLNGQGVRSLADLAGRPVIVEFWGTH